MLSPEVKEIILAGLRASMTEARENSATRGFPAWEGDNLPTGLMLLVTEVSEMMDAFRRTPEGSVDMPPDFYYEAADVFIRLMDIMMAQPGGRAMFADAVIAKMEYNRTRAWRHGGKRV